MSPPSPPRFLTPPTWIALLAILVTVLAISTAPEPAREGGAVPDSEANVLLKLQCKLVAGIAQLDRGTAVREARKLQSLAQSPASRRALASLYVFIDGDELNEAFEKLLDGDESRAAGLLRELERSEGALAEEEREALEFELGWFGRLALARDDERLRSELQGSGLILFGVAFGLSALFLVGFFVGSVLLIVGVNRWKVREEGREEAPPPDRGGIYVEGFALYLIAMLVFMSGVEMISPSNLAGMNGAILLALLTGLGWTVLRGVPRDVLRQETGLSVGRGWWREVAAGIVGYIAIIPVMAVGLVTTMVLQRLGVEEPGEGSQPISHPLFGFLENASASGVLLILGLAAVIAPVTEEIAFRGLLQRGLRSRFAGWVALPLMALVFAAVHPQGVLAIPALMAMAIGFGLIREWRGSLIAPMVAHGLHNGMIVGLLAIAVS